MHIRGKTGSAEVYGKQSTSWVATYDENYVVVMMVSQAGTGSGTSGPGGPRDLGGALRHQRHDGRTRAAPRSPAPPRPQGLPDVHEGRLDPAARPEGVTCPLAARARPLVARQRAARPGLDWVLMLAVLALVTLGSLLVWSATSHRDDLTARRPHGVPEEAAGQHRHRAGAAGDR